MTYTPATAQDVREVTGSDSGDRSISPFIAAAQAMIDAADDGREALALTQAHIFLSAHLFTLSPVGRGSAQIKSESLAGKYSVVYSDGRSGEGILSTAYGQTANALMGGRLFELDKRQPNIMSIGSLGGDQGPLGFE